MEWLSQNWIWIVFIVGMFLLMRRGGMGGCHAHGDNLPSQQHETGDGRQADGGEQPMDPISGEAVNTESAPNSFYRGRVYYFASSKNRDAFEVSPEQYASGGREPTGEHRHHRHGC